LGLFFNQKQKTKIFHNSNDKIKETNQDEYRENFLQSVMNEQQQLNKQFAENATKHAEKHERYSQALLDQLTTQDSLLLDMHRKLQANEKTAISIQEQLQIQDDIKDLLERHDDLQNIYHQTLMERFDNQDSDFIERMNRHDRQLLERLQKQENQITKELDKQDTQLTEHLNRQHTQLNTELYKMHTQVMSQLNHQDLQSSERFELSVAKLNDYFNQYGQQYNEQTNKLDTIMEQFRQHDYEQASRIQQINHNLTENFRDQDAAIKEQLGKKDAQINEYVSKLDNSLTEHLDKQNEHLKQLVDHQDIQNEQLERKLDFLKSTIFERAADLSEKLDGHFKKFTEFFGSLFTRYERNESISLPEEKEKEEKIETQ
jgi:hypothetical protein